MRAVAETVIEYPFPTMEMEKSDERAMANHLETTVLIGFTILAIYAYISTGM
jgi:hypothetical protein